MASNKVKTVIGDNLASHLSHAVIKGSQENNIYMAAVPSNLTHMNELLGVSVFVPIKRNWRQILDNWGKIIRIREAPFPRSSFHCCLTDSGMESILLLMQI